MSPSSEKPKAAACMSPSGRSGGGRRSVRKKVGRAILTEEDNYGPCFDALATGKPRSHLAVDQLRSRIEDERLEAAKAEKPEFRCAPPPKPQEGIAYIIDDPAKLQELREQLKTRERKVGRQQKRRRGLSV